MPKLVLKIDGQAPRDITITREMTFGRHPGNDVEIHDEKASRRHFRVRSEGPRVVIDDLNSSNGTRINGNRITTCVLKHGDVIMVGAAAISFIDESADAVVKTKDKIPEKDGDRDDRHGEHKIGTITGSHEGTKEKPKEDEKKSKKKDDDEDIYDRLKKAREEKAKAEKSDKSDKSDKDKKSKDKRDDDDDDEDSVFSKKKQKKGEKKKPDDEDDEDSVFSKKKKDEKKKPSADDDDDDDDDKFKRGAPETRKGIASASVSGRNTSVRRFRRRPSGSSLAGLAIFAAAAVGIAVFVVGSANQNGNEKGDKVAHNNSKTPNKTNELPPIVSNPNPIPFETTPRPAPPPVVSSTQRVNTPDKPPDPSTTPDTPVQPAQTEEITDKAALEDLKKAVAERDKLIAAGNFPVARGAFKDFLQKYAIGEVSVRGRKEQYNTEQLIDSALGNDLRDAQKAVSEKKYRVATQRCTRLLAMAPTGKIGVAAKQILSKLDTDTEASFNEAKESAAKAIEGGNLQEAADVLGKAIELLGGTKWAEPISVEQLKVLMTLKLMKTIDEERQKKGKVVQVPLAGVNRFGALSKIDGFNIEVLDEKKKVLKMSMIHMEPWEVEHIFKSIGMADRHVELACMYMIMQKEEPAQETLAKAMADSRQLLDAIRLSGGEIAQFKNLKVYDFSKWQHQADWEATAGSWYTKDDQFVLESAEGGDCMLRADTIGGGFTLNKGRISFQFEPVKPKKGFFFGFEFGSGDKNPLTVSFAEAGVTVQADLGKPASESEKSWKPELTNVDIAVDGDKLTVSINGKAMKPLTVEGLGKVKGTLTFRVRESACNIDDIILRNIAEEEAEK